VSQSAVAAGRREVSVPTDTILIVGGFWIVCGIASLLIAQSRGANASSWFVVGVILGPIGILLALTAKPAAPVEFAPQPAPADSPTQRTGLAAVPGALWTLLAVAVGVGIAYVILVK